jgi:hypothetical protein
MHTTRFRARHVGLIGWLGYVLIGSIGCAAPIATHTPAPATSAPVSVTSTASTLNTATPRSVAVLPSRTPLPSVTPAGASQGAGATGTRLPASPIPASTSTPIAPAQPTSTSALLAMTPVVGLTPLPTNPIILPGNPPPLDIKLPPNWKYGYQVLPIRDRLVQAAMNVAIYRGPVQGGIGTIILLWGFPSLGPPPTISAAQVLGTPVSGTLSPDLQRQMLWADGLRLLQGTVVDITCNVGNHSRSEFQIGGQTAIGEYFAAVQCQGEPDATGWFAALNQFGGNFIFYVTIEPPEAYNNGRSEVQKILDTVVFRRPGETPVGPPPTNTGVAATTTPSVQ